MTNPEEAAKELEAAGYEPLAPYPGKVMLPWQARCKGCGTARNPTLNSIRRGDRCKHVNGAIERIDVTPEGAEQEMLAAGYRPFEPYPGSTRKPWHCWCTTCFQDRWPNLTAVRQGRRCTHGRASRKPKDW